MKLSGKSIDALKGMGVKLLVIVLAVTTGVWVAAHMVPSINASSGQIEAIALEAQAQANKPMWDPKNPKTAAALAEPGRQRQIDNASAISPRGAQPGVDPSKASTATSEATKSQAER